MSQPHLTSPTAKPLGLINHPDEFQLQRLYQQGDECAAQGDYDQAIAYYTQIITLDSESIDAYCARGRSQMALKCYAEAKLDYVKAIDLSPISAIAYCGLAKVYYGFREYPAAIVAIDLAISLEGSNLDFYGCRAMINHRLGNREQVLVDCRIVLERQPQDTSTR